VQLGALQQQFPWLSALQSAMQNNEKKRKDYAFQRQFIEKPSFVPGRPLTLQ